MAKLNQESLDAIIEAGYIPEGEPVSSDGEHASKYGGRFHATCLNVPPCNPSRNGALVAQNGEGEAGFGTLAEILAFMARAFPQHLGHTTRFIVPNSIIINNDP